MILPISSSTSAFTAVRSLSPLDFSTSIRRLSSGLQIERAADNPAGLFIAQTMTAQLRGLQQAGMNVQLGVSLTQTAEGALGQIQDSLQRMRELSIQASSDTLTTEDRTAINAELQQLGEHIEDVTTQTSFNEVRPLTTPQPMVVQAGPDAGQTASVPAQGPTLAAMEADLDTALDAFSADPTTSNAQVLTAEIDEALETVSGARAELGATQNRFEATINSLSSAALNTETARSRIQDADVAAEATNLARSKILTEARVSVLIQANVGARQALRLIESFQPRSLGSAFLR